MREVRIKSRSDIAGIYMSCRIVAALLGEVEGLIRPGVTTLELDRWAEDFIRTRGAAPAFKGYRGFPATLCVSLNDEIVHGIPGDRVLSAGDVVKIDVGANLDGRFSDAARTFAVGKLNGEAPALLAATKNALDNGIEAISAGGFLNDIGRAVQGTIQGAGYKVIRDLTGHGVGFSQHEPPTVYNYPVPDEDMKIRNGMVLAIEPMASIGSEKIFCASDGWTYKTLDGSLAAHFEHTVAIWDGMPVVLTATDGELAEELFGEKARSV